MRKINFIGLHCSASDVSSHDNAKTIDDWHKARGWSQIGYNFFIRNNGAIEIGRPIDLVPAHIGGFNKHSVGICLHGLNKFSDEQFRSCAKLCNMLMHVFNLDIKDIVLHNELDNKKTCPNFPKSKIIELMDDVKNNF